MTALLGIVIAAYLPSVLLLIWLWRTPSSRVLPRRYF